VQDLSHVFSQRGSASFAESCEGVRRNWVRSIIMASNKREVRTFKSVGTLRAMSQGDEMAISGRALSYRTLSGDLGGFREQLLPGCFSRHLAENPDVLCLREHENSQLLGRTKNGTLTLTDGPDGLDFRCVINPSDPQAVSTHAAIQRGDLDRMSFAFGVDGDDGDTFDSASDENGRSIVRRSIKRAKIFDVSPVVRAAYPNGTSVAARAADYSIATSRAVPTVVTHPNLFRAQAAADAEKRKQRHAEVRRICANYPELSFEHVAQCLKLGYSEDLMLQLRFAAITEKLARAGASFEVEPMRSGLNAQPGSTPDTDDFDPADASEPDEHRKAAAWHRAVAAKAKTMEAASVHFKCADAHDLAAQTGDANDSSRARAASRNLRGSY